MKIQARQVDSFIKNPDARVSAALIYGSDGGLARERVLALAKTVVADVNDPFNTALLSTDILSDDPARLSDEANAISLTGGRRLVRVENGRDSIAPLLKDYLAHPNDHALVIVEAGELGPRSPLRALFEKLDHAAALPCYAEDERDSASFIRSFLAESGLNASQDAVMWLASAIGGDRMRMRSELEKLSTYMGGDRNVAIDHAQAVCGDSGMRDLDALIYGTAGGRAAEAMAAWKHLAGEGMPVVTVLRSLQNHFRRLHLARTRMDSGDTAEGAVKSLNPPVFFKQEQAFRGQLNRWALPALERTLARLADLEAQCKRTNAPDETLCAQALLSIGAGGGR